MSNKIEIDLNAIAHNVRVIKSHLDPETKLIGVVKDNAYGHGLVDTARAIWTAGADILAVRNVEEAVALRVGKIRSPILILGYVDHKNFRKLLDFDITLTIFDFETALHLSQEAAKLNKWARVDIKVDTGLNRYGFATHEVVEQYQKIAALEHLKVEGIHSHLAEPSDKEFTSEQISQLQGVLFSFQQNRIAPPMVHLAATRAVFEYPEAHFDAVRVGIGLYGYSGYGESTSENDKLQPVLELKSQIAQIRRVGKGQSIGYGRTVVAKNPMKLAVIPLGYADGYPRALSNKTDVLIDGHRAKVTGRVAMDAICADVTGVKCVVGDEVTLIGKQGEEKIFADELAKAADTIEHEILSRLPMSLPREYHFK